jgi:hypothetical protein
MVLGLRQHRCLAQKIVINVRFECTPRSALVSKEANGPCLRLTLLIDLAYCMLKLCRTVGPSSLEMEDGTEKKLRRSKGGNGKLVQCVSGFKINLN